MKRWIGMIVMACLLVFSSMALAESQLSPDEIRGNGGPQFGVIKLSLGDLNNALETYGYAPLSEWVVLYGGGGIGGTRSGLRFGGYGAGAETTSVTANGDKAILAFGFGGCVIERGVYVNGKTDIAVGGMFGGGGASLELKPYPQLAVVGSNPSLPTQELSKGFIILEPRVNVHHQIGKQIGLEFIASYMLTYDFNQTWEIAGQSVAGPFHFNGGPQVGVRVTFGF